MNLTEEIKLYSYELGETAFNKYHERLGTNISLHKFSLQSDKQQLAWIDAAVEVATKALTYV